MIGKHLFSFMDEEGVKICKKNLERRKQGIKEQHEFEFIRKDGEKIYTLMETSPIIDEKGNYNGALAGVLNITEYKNLQEQLIQSEKLSAVGQLAAGVAHEFNNILGVIRLRTQFIKFSMLNEIDIPKYLEMIETQTDRGAKIVNDINRFAKPSLPYLTIQNLSDVINSTVKLIKKQLSLDKIKVITDYKKHSEVLIDPLKIQQVLLNLIINARHAILPKRKGAISISVKDINNHVEIQITDNGIGMDNKTINNIFTPFFTTKGAKSKGKFKIEGTGLGLSVTHSIIKQHKGTISVESKPGKGTTFFITLPKALTEEKKKEIKKKIITQKKDPRIKDMNILIIDDEENMLKVFLEILKLKGFNKVIRADSGKKALKLFNNQKFDAVFLDILMPDMNGKEICNNLKKIRKNIPVVFISGQADFEQDVFIKKNGFAFLKKPFDYEDIINILEKIRKNNNGK